MKERLFYKLENEKKKQVNDLFQRKFFFSFLKFFVVIVHGNEYFTLIS